MLIEFANYANDKKFLDSDSHSLLKDLSKNFSWEKPLQGKFYILKTHGNGKRLSFKLYLTKLNNIKYSYQVDFFSFRFVLILFKIF